MQNDQGGELVLTEGAGRSRSQRSRADGEDRRRRWAQFAEDVTEGVRRVC